MQIDPQSRNQERGAISAQHPAIHLRAQADSLRGGGGKEFSFPLTTLQQLMEYLLSARPIYLVAMEFSGALLITLLDAGVAAMSVDRRHPDHALPSFMGEVETVVQAQQWTAVFFVGPNCFQHLRGD